jgi:hypothetical protein
MFAHMALRHSLMEWHLNCLFVHACAAMLQVYSIDERTNNIVVRNRLECMYCDECTVVASTLKARPEDDPVVTVAASTDRCVILLMSCVVIARAQSRAYVHSAACVCCCWALLLACDRARVDFRLSLCIRIR